MTHIHIKLCTDGAINPLKKQLEECSKVILFGLEILEIVNVNPPDLGLLENSIFSPLKFGDNEENIETRKVNFKNRLIKKGVEELIKGVEASLREAYSYINIYHLPLNEIKTENQLIEYIDKVKKLSSSINIPGLIEEIENKLIKPLVYKKQILSINKLRNCLVHRNGLVSKKDINNIKDGTLDVEGIRLCIIYEKNGRTEEIVKPGIVEGGAGIQITTRKELIKFKEGEKIILGYKEFNDLIMTCLQFGNDLTSSLPIQKQSQNQ